MKRDDWAIKGIGETVRKVLGREPTNNCEVGVWQGSLSQRLLREFPEAFLFMVDQYQPYEDKLGRKPIEEIYDAMLLAGKATDFAATRRMFLITSSVVASQMFPKKCLDMCYLDADHSEASTYREFQTWYPKVILGGWFGGHDYDGVGDKKGMFGVKKAIDRAAYERGLEVKTTHQNIWYVKKPG